MANPIPALVLALCLAPRPVEAQSIAASLSDYQATLRLTTVAGVSARSFSGVAFHPETRTLFVIDNDNAVIYELNAAGVLQRSITTTGITDPEGIVYQGDDYFLIAEEGLANIVRLKLPRTGSGPVAKSGGAALNIGPNMANSGIEGVGYRSSDKTAYAVKEIDPPRLYRITLDGSGNPTASFPDDPFSIAGRSGDAADVFALNDGNFILVNQEQNRLEGYGPQGQALSTLPLGMSKPEGMALDAADGTLYVVGEPLEVTVFRKKGTRARTPASRSKADPGYAFSVRPGRAPGLAPVLRLSLPSRTLARLDYCSLGGSCTEVFRGPLDPGRHDLGTPWAPPAGIGFYRCSAGSFLRIVKFISP